MSGLTLLEGAQLGFLWTAMDHNLSWLCRLCSCVGVQIQDSEKIQKLWAFRRRDAEEKNPAAPPWCRLMPEPMHMRIYIEMEKTFISFLALLGIPVRSQQNVCTAGKCGWHGHVAYGISAISAMKYL